MTRVLVIAAHPDDEVLGMGGTIALHATVRGDDVRIVCATRRFAPRRRKRRGRRPQSLA